MRLSLLTLSPLSALVLLFACDRAPEPAHKPVNLPPSPAAPAADDKSFVFPGGERIVAFGDVHGDLAATRAALQLAGAIDDKDEWIGGKLIVVQTGDQLDRGDDEPDILDLFEALQKKAEKAGGRFYVLNGNHEVMNVAGDFRYVTEDGFKDFDGTKPTSGSAGLRADTLPESQRGRAAAFLPGGALAKRLAERPIAIVVGDTVFAHGGVLPGHVRSGLGKMNREAKEWMLGETKRKPPSLDDEHSPIWSRDFSDGEPSARSCGALDRSLSLLKAARMVVGHTVQKGGITSACNGKVWRIDVGMVKHYGGKPAVLEIKGGQVRVISAETAAAPSDGDKAKKGDPAVDRSAAAKTSTPEKSGARDDRAVPKPAVTSSKVERAY